MIRIAFLVLLAVTAAQPLQAQSWQLAPQPILRVGGMTNDPRYQLSVVVGATKLANGNVVIADRIAARIRMFDPTGRFLKEVGGEGQGPGEYEYLRGIGPCAAERIVVYDVGWDETHYDSGLNLVGTRPAELTALGGTGYRSACNPSGYVIATGWGDIGMDFKRGYYVAKAPVVLVRDGDLIRELGERLSSERVGRLRDDGSPGGSFPHPFGRQTSVAIGPDRAYVGSAGAYEIEVFDLDGRPLPKITWSGPDLSTRKDDFDLLVERAVEAAPEGRRPAVRRSYRDVPRLERFPAYDRLITDRAGNLWVRYFLRPDRDEREWVVFNEDGERIGGISVPSQATVLEVGEDYLILSRLDELDVPTVELYTLLKS